LASKIGDVILDQHKSIFLKPSNFQLKALAVSKNEDVSYSEDVREALKDDHFTINIITQMNYDKDSTQLKKKLQFKDGLLYYNSLLYVTLGLVQRKIFQLCHDFPVVGHFDFNKIVELICIDS